MSGLEIVAAVSAVVSAFHGGSELLKLVKQKRRARKVRDQVQQEWEEEQLQASLLTGEQQINLRYKQDQMELGDCVRIGDETARERLYHIALMLQAEIINSLKRAATNEVCVLKLHVLHEASTTKRRETLTTLDELKQRIYIARPMARQLRAISEDHAGVRQSSASAHTAQTHNHANMRSLSDNYTTTSFPPRMDLGDTRHSLTDYCQDRDIRNSTSISRSAYTLAQAADPNFSLALDGLRPDDRASIMRDIQHMISSYQGLGVETESRSSKGHIYSGAHPARRDTLTILNDRDSYEEPMQRPDRGLSQHFQEASPISGTTNTNRPLFPIEKEQHVYDYSYPPPNQYSQTGTATLYPRWSDTSSSAQSNTASLGPNSSNSSQGDQVRSQVSPHDKHDESHSGSPYSSPYVSANDRYTPSPIAPLAPSRPRPDAPSTGSSKHDANTPAHMPWPGSQQQRDPSPPLQYTPMVQYMLSQPCPQPIEENAVDISKSLHPQYRVTPPTERSTSSLRSNNDHQTTAYSPPAVAATPSKSGSTAISHPRHTSITRSIASTDSISSASIGVLPGRRMRDSIRSDTIQSGPAGGEKMMNGRPNKDNDYWGFCKGAWAVREDPKKGITVRTQPSGYYNTRQIWGCKSCTFTGDVFTAPHPTKKNKTVEIVDPRVKISMSGIRYRWIFLAKSHVRKKASDSSSNGDNFGCVLCLAQDKVTGVYGGTETLMNHIALTHVADMSEQTRKKVNCILGRVAKADEEFDINVPINKKAELMG
ncbi:hypothetical protein G6011_10646 [Alternaria panax]|uniref:Uncharacterized protein n=1 Tax=Alternaria panax TaxID=48097 RepID=A0AAD4ICD1_9PLEO|nr:hypothetical protein G6011_10646 [Alternaria panax]